VLRESMTKCCVKYDQVEYDRAHKKECVCDVLYSEAASWRFFPERLKASLVRTPSKSLTKSSLLLVVLIVVIIYIIFFIIYNIYIFYITT
jgi:hypothetical protein